MCIRDSARTTSTGTQRSGPPAAPSDGSAPNNGRAGSGPLTTSAGANTVPAPIANPGPATHATAHTTRFGAIASWATASSRPLNVSRPSPSTTSPAAARPEIAQVPASAAAVSYTHLT